MYWAEGAKTTPRLGMVNTDPRALRLFILWVRTYLDFNAEFALALHLHEGNDEKAARNWWADALGIHDVQFQKTFVKPPGTGHRKNRWLHGVCRVQMRRSADAHYRTMEWIDCLAKELEQPPLIQSSTRVASSTAEQIPLKDKVQGSNPWRPTKPTSFTTRA